MNHHILWRKEKYALCIFTVASRAARLLIVILHALGHIIVNHKPHVRLINPHSERIRSNNNLHPVVDKIILTLLARRIVNSSMISCHRNAHFKKIFIQHIYILPGCAVDDSTIMRMLLNIIHDKLLFLSARKMLHAVIQILSIESGHNNIRMIEFQNTLYICLNLIRGRRCKCTYNRPLRQAFDKINNL